MAENDTPAVDPDLPTEETPSAVQDEKAKPYFSPEVTKQSLTLLAEMITVVGFLGFLGSILLNSYVFQKWNLNFLQVASLSDVVMSGLQLSIDIASLSVMVVAGYAIGRLFYGLFKNYTFPEVRTAKDWCLGIADVSRIGIALILIAASPVVALYVLWWGVGSIYLLNAIAFCIGFVVGSINRARFWTSQGMEFAAAVSIASIVLGLFIYVYVQAFLSKDSVIGGGVEDGFLSKRRAFRVETVDPACPGPPSYGSASDRSSAVVTDHAASF